MPRPKTIILVTSRTNQDEPKQVYTSLTSLVKKRPDLALKIRKVYAYINIPDTPYLTDKVMIERLPIIHPHTGD